MCTDGARASGPGAWLMERLPKPPVIKSGRKLANQNICENLVTDVRDLIDWWWGGLAQATDPEPGSRVPASRGHGRYRTVPGPISDQFAEVGGERIEGKGREV